ncbi:3-oxoacyl-[acyl-carrier-protein] synthase III C-terminal domain-containing protein [Microvirga sp. 2MCAF38]|uniref:3-oxoacyl-[acyl-carrier-protein] synthase III C-terminal domain-containing protein n=1 Tax=Microvirga sp. 2MCAF38 TaxID=3232989 RepID=UPI003F9540B1
MTKSIGFLGFGSALPDHVRCNDDPVFDALRNSASADAAGEKALFYGNKERRCLAQNESLAGLVANAGHAALNDAQMATHSIDRLYGYLSVSDYIAPNALYDVHRIMGLPVDTLVVPVQSEFSNFLLSATLATEAILAGNAKTALVAVGAGWTRNMDYSQGHAIGIGDGAGAAVIGESERFVVVDWASDTFSNEYGAMAMHHWPHKGLAYPTYGIDPSSGVQAFLSTGMDGPPRLIKRLLDKNGVAPRDVTLISHQATQKLLDHWNEQIQPAAYLDTFESLGNMVIASIPVTLAQRHSEIRTPWLVMVGLGIGAHQMALLIRV